MPNDHLPDDLKSLWHELGTNPVCISLEELQREAKALEARIRRRHFFGFYMASIGIASFSTFLFVFPNVLLRVGSALIVLGICYMLVQLGFRRARTLPDPAAMSCAVFYRAELERQRDFHRGRWFWSRSLIFLPGPVLFFIGLAQTYPKRAAFVWLEFALALILAVIAVPLNFRLARKYQRRIDALDASRNNS
jgi:hypothetical protein